MFDQNWQISSHTEFDYIQLTQSKPNLFGFYQVGLNEIRPNWVELGSIEIGWVDPDLNFVKLGRIN